MQKAFRLFVARFVVYASLCSMFFNTPKSASLAPTLLWQVLLLVLPRDL